jgi:rubredoxin
MTWFTTSERSKNVATNLETRVRRLEEVGSERECPRCSGTTIIYLNNELESVSKAGRIFTPEEARAFVDEEDDGRCPLCGTSRGPEIVVGWWGE